MNERRKEGDWRKKGRERQKEEVKDRRKENGGGVRAEGRRE